MKQCWRWFGPNDPTQLSDLHMVGVEGIVTALHDLPPGEVWSSDAISKRKSMIEAAGLTWDVVESVPVSEAIKTQGKGAVDHIDNYKASLRNLAANGVETVCYNFMPILDWTRTKLREPQPHGGTAMAFDLIDFAVFDLFVLEREQRHLGVERAAEAVQARLGQRRRVVLVASTDRILRGHADGMVPCQVAAGADRVAGRDEHGRAGPVVEVVQRDGAVVARQAHAR